MFVQRSATPTPTRRTPYVNVITSIPPQTTIIYITSNYYSPTPTPIKNGPSSSTTKATIAGSVVGSFLGSVIIVGFLAWLFLRRRSPPNTQQARLNFSGKSQPSSWFFPHWRSNRNVPDSKSLGLRPPARTAAQLGIFSSYRTSFDSDSPPTGIPMVQPSFAIHNPTSPSRNRIMNSMPWKRASNSVTVSSSGSDMAEMKPQYQYGVVGSRRASLATIPPSPVISPSTTRPDSPTSYRSRVASIGAPHESFDVRYRDLPTPPPFALSRQFLQDGTTPHSISSFEHLNVQSGIAPSGPPPQNFTHRNTTLAAPTNWQTQTTSGSDSKHSHSSESQHVLIKRSSGDELHRSRQTSLPGRNDHGVSNPYNSYHRSTRSDEGHGDSFYLPSSHVHSRPGPSVLQRSHSMEHDAYVVQQNRERLSRRVYENRARAGGTLPPPSAFSFTLGGGSMMLAADTAAEDASDESEGGYQFDPRRQSRRRSASQTRHRASSVPNSRVDVNVADSTPTAASRLHRSHHGHGSRPPSPASDASTSDGAELAALARDARRAERRMRREMRRSLQEREPPEEPKRLVLRNA